MFRKMIARLNDHYIIQAEKCSYDIAIKVFCDDDVVGNARLTTDNVDVSCVTELCMEEKHINHFLNEHHTIGDAFFKFLLKFPNDARKLEFRFILNAPDNFKKIIEKYHFDRGEKTNVEKELLIRREKTIPFRKNLPENICIMNFIDESRFDELLDLIQKNAYWQANLTIDRLSMLVRSSLCFFVISHTGEILGFSRVLTNYKSFASLWDVVVADSYRGNNIATAMMHEVFSHERLCNIPNWILFTESAKKLYEKFGFVPAVDMPERRLIHKLRPQGCQPAYMQELLQVVLSKLTVDLNPEQALAFLFGSNGKRHRLPHFWNNNTDSKNNNQLVSISPLNGISLKLN